jgi:hypothetical protein
MNPKHIVRHGYDLMSHAYRSDTQTDPGAFYAKWTADPPCPITDPVRAATRR